MPTVNAEDEAKQVWVDCAGRLKIPPVIIECALNDENLHRKRLEARVRGLHGSDEITWERVKERRKAYTPWKQKVLTLGMGKNTDDNLRLALEFVGRIK